MTTGVGKLDIDIGMIRHITRAARQELDNQRIKAFNRLAAKIHTTAEQGSNELVIRRGDVLYPLMDERTFDELVGMHYTVIPVESNLWERFVYHEPVIKAYKILW